MGLINNDLRRTIEQGSPARRSASAFTILNALKLSQYLLLNCVSDEADEIVATEFSRYPDIVDRANLLVGAARRSKRPTYSEDVNLVDE